MKQFITRRPAAINVRRQQPIVKPWVIVKSNRQQNGPAYPPVIMPRESHGYIKANRFDFL